MSREFVVPSDLEVFEKLEVWPEEDDEGVRLLTFPSEGRGKFIFSYDSLGSSVRLRWSDEAGEEVLDVFREGATLMRVESGVSLKAISVTFDLNGLSGTLNIQVAPTVGILDRMLF